MKNELEIREMTQKVTHLLEVVEMMSQETKTDTGECGRIIETMKTALIWVLGENETEIKPFEQAIDSLTQMFDAAVKLKEACSI